MWMFIVHPRKSKEPPADRDFAIMLHEWAVPNRPAGLNPGD